jgi:hypothetical protein
MNHRFQFSIRTLFLLTLVMAISCQIGPSAWEAIRPRKYVTLDFSTPPFQECLPDGTSFDLVKLDLKTRKWVWIESGEPLDRQP